VSKLTQTSSLEDYANKFKSLCNEIVTLPMNAKDKIHCFITRLKREIRLMITVDTMNSAQLWEVFQWLVIYIVFRDASF
jgi:hypothetical protein